MLRFRPFFYLIKTLLLVFFQLAANAQVVNTATMDTSDISKKGKVVIGGYGDAYFAYDLNEPDGNDMAYQFNSSRHNEMAINLVFLDLKYNSENIRARIVPGFGTYMEANYAGEPAGLRNLVEARAGVLISKKKNIWLDAGIFGSPYTNESCISKDHLVYSRSFAPEYVPYYLSGLKLSVPLSPKMNLYLYGYNGWQNIRETNASKSAGTQLEYTVNNNLLLNWNTYVGDERSDAHPDFGMRYFSDVFFIYKKGKFDATGCVYAGVQEKKDSLSPKISYAWWQANLMGRFRFTNRLSLSGRVEYFSDPHLIQITPITGLSSFDCFSATLCPNIHINENAMIRFDLRYFKGKDDLFFDKDGLPTDQSIRLMSNITVWF